MNTKIILKGRGEGKTRLLIEEFLKLYQENPYRKYIFLTKSHEESRKFAYRIASLCNNLIVNKDRFIVSSSVEEVEREIKPGSCVFADEYFQKVMLGEKVLDIDFTLYVSIDKGLLIESNSSC